MVRGHLNFSVAGWTINLRTPLRDPPTKRVKHWPREKLTLRNGMLLMRKSAAGTPRLLIQFGGWVRGDAGGTHAAVPTKGSQRGNQERTWKIVSPLRLYL
jgi:hypothetical protein